MAEDWLTDVRKYAPDADASVVASIVNYCGIALRNRDSSLVSFDDPAEVGRVRENFLKKKLGLTQDDATLDQSIHAVGDRMEGDRTKNRVTVYYLLARHFGLLNIFGGTDKVAPLAGAAAATTAAAAALHTPHPEPERVTQPAAAYTTYEEEPKSGGIGRWLPWLILGLLLLGLIYALTTCSDRADETVPAPVVDEPVVAPAPTSAVAIPTGSGIVAEERDSRPMLTVYFDTAKSEVHTDLSTAASAVKGYIDANPGTTLAVSGFNDPTGNAAANAELSKSRAENVKAALQEIGIPESRIVLDKPAETTGTGDTNAESRRVEVVIRDTVTQ